MPSVFPNSPNEYTAFGSEEEHTRAHRALESAVESIDTAGLGSTGTISTATLVATPVGFGGQVPTTSSTAAPVKGVFRTAAVVGAAVGWIATNSVYVATFSVAGQMGNNIQIGDPINVSAITTLPTNAVQLGGGLVVGTNTVQVAFLANAGGINTTTVSFHVFTWDIT
jgi:hypothetical protein